MPGLQQAILNYGRQAMGVSERAGMGLGKYIGSAIASPFARRTSLGAVGGAIAGGIMGGRPGTGFSFSGAAVGAGVGAAGARYGGAFMKAGMTSGIGMRGAAARTMALGRQDFRRIASQGRAAGTFIGNHISQTYGRIRGLFG